MINLLFPCPIKVEKLDIDTSDIQKRVYSIFDKMNFENHVLERGQAMSTHIYQDGDINGYQLNWLDEFKPLVELVENHADEYWLGYGLDPYYQPQVLNLWSNLHRKGGHTTTHFHSGSPFVASFYLKTPQNCGNIVFENPLEYHMCHEPRKQGLEYTHEVEENQLVLFPGWLKHRTEENRSDEDRIVIAFNFEIINRKPISYSFADK